MRHRLVTAETAVVDAAGYIHLRDRNGVLRWSNSPADRAAEAIRGFDINANRLSNLHRLIVHRYGGPVTTDDAANYLSVAFNAIALSRRLKRWKQSIGPLMTWSAQWTPLADPTEVAALAASVMRRPRKMTAGAAGRLVHLSVAEWRHLNLKTFDPSDLSAEAVKAVKIERRRHRDREAAAAARRKDGARSPKPHRFDRSASGTASPRGHSDIMLRKARIALRSI